MREVIGSEMVAEIHVLLCAPRPGCILFTSFVIVVVYLRNVTHPCKLVMCFSAPPLLHSYYSFLFYFAVSPSALHPDPNATSENKFGEV